MARRESSSALQTHVPYWLDTTRRRGRVVQATAALLQRCHVGMARQRWFNAFARCLMSHARRAAEEEEQLQQVFAGAAVEGEKVSNVEGARVEAEAEEECAGAEAEAEDGVSRGLGRGTGSAPTVNADSLRISPVARTASGAASLGLAALAGARRLALHASPTRAQWARVAHGRCWPLGRSRPTLQPPRTAYQAPAWRQQRMRVPDVWSQGPGPEQMGAELRHRRRRRRIHRGARAWEEEPLGAERTLEDVPRDQGLHRLNARRTRCRVVGAGPTRKYQQTGSMVATTATAAATMRRRTMSGMRTRMRTRARRQCTISHPGSSRRSGCRRVGSSRPSKPKVRLRTRRRLPRLGPRGTTPNNSGGRPRSRIHPHVSAGRRNKKVDKAERALTKIRFEVEAYEEEVHRQRKAFDVRLEQAEQKCKWRRDQLDELHAEAGSVSTARAGDDLCNMLAKEMVAMAELLEEGSEARSKANLLLSRIADVAGRSRRGQCENFDIAEGDNGTDVEDDDMRGGGASDRAARGTTAGAADTAETANSATWSADANGRWRNRRHDHGDGGNDGAGGGKGKHGKEGGKAPPHGARGEQQAAANAAAAAVQGGANGTGGTRTGAENARGGTRGREDVDAAPLPPNKSHRGEDDPQVHSVEGTGDDQARAQKLRQEQEIAIQTARAAKATFGDEVSMQIAGQLYAHKISLAAERARKVGIEAVVGGKQLIDLAPEAFTAWLQDVLTPAEAEVAEM